MAYIDFLNEENEEGLEHIPEKYVELFISDKDVIIEKDKQYGSSWKKRGGVGAFMMLARKFDRIETFYNHNGGGTSEITDIITSMKLDESVRDESVKDDIDDLRRYLFLVLDNLFVDFIDILTRTDIAGEEFIGWEGVIDGFKNMELGLGEDYNIFKSDVNKIKDLFITLMEIGVLYNASLNEDPKLS